MTITRKRKWRISVKRRRRLKRYLAPLQNGGIIEWDGTRILVADCKYCGFTLPAKALTIDHISPRARGGSSIKPNLCLACKDCNNRKADKELPVEVRLRKVGEASTMASAEQNSPAYWETRGYQREFGDAAVLDPHFEVLRKITTTGASFVVLCPTFLRRPLILELDAHASIKTFAGGIY